MERYGEVIDRWFTLVSERDELQNVEMRFFKFLYGQAIAGNEVKFDTGKRLLDELHRHRKSTNRILKFCGQTAQNFIQPAMNTFVNVTKDVPGAKELAPNIENIIRFMDSQIAHIKTLRQELEQKLREFEKGKDAPPN